MGSKELRGRRVWQDVSGYKAGVAEHTFLAVFENLFRRTPFRIRPKPKEFSNIYTAVTLPPEEIAQIYTPKDPIKRHGLLPDYAIDNTASDKTLYVEVKRQDGWVEGGKRADGRGNAHERSCKFFTPGLLTTLRQQGGLGAEVLPFWTVFQGDITRDPCRVREISLWYKGHESHFFFWRSQADADSLIQHFETKLKHLLM
jgi:hypothetical protein